MAPNGAAWYALTSEGGEGTSIVSIELYRTVVIPEYRAADLNEVIRELHDLRERLGDPRDGKARRTVEKGRVAVADLSWSLRFSEHDTVAGLIAADEPREDIPERVALLALALIQRDLLHHMSTIEHYREVVIQYTKEDRSLNEVIRELYDLREQLKDLEDREARQTIDMGRTAAIDLDTTLRLSEHQTVVDLIADEVDLRGRVTQIAMALVKRDELRG